MLKTLQQNRSVTGEDKVATDAGECKQYCGMPLLTDLAVMMRIDPLALIHGLPKFVTVMYGQEFCDVCQPGLSRGLFRAELGRAEGVERAGQRR